MQRLGMVSDPFSLSDLLHVAKKVVLLLNLMSLLQALHFSLQVSSIRLGMSIWHHDQDLIVFIELQCAGRCSNRILKHSRYPWTEEKDIGELNFARALGFLLAVVTQYCFYSVFCVRCSQATDSSQDPTLRKGESVVEVSTMIGQTKVIQDYYYYPWAQQVNITLLCPLSYSYCHKFKGIRSFLRQCIIFANYGVS